MPRFLDLTAADLMSRDVVAISQNTSLRDAAHRLARANISGAPVVDDQGRCIGVLSSTDFLRCVEKGKVTSEPTYHPCFCSDWGLPDPDSLPNDAVARFMTRDPVQASPAISITALADLMMDAHIHRLIIVDEDRKPIGIVSSTDILAAVARAGHEARPLPPGNSLRGRAPPKPNRRG